MTLINTLTKRDLKERFLETALPTYHYIKQEEAKRLVDKFFELMVQNIVDGKTIYFPRIGKIVSTVKKAGRPVRNPRTGEQFAMPATVNIKFSNMSKQGEKMLRSKFITLFATYFRGTDYAKFHQAQIMFDEFAYMLMQVKRSEARIEIRGFASFAGKKMQPRKARNPKTGESVDVGSKVKISMRAGKPMLEAAKEKQLG